MTPDEMNEDETIKRLGTIVRNMVTSYVNRKAAKKLGLNWDEFKKDDKNRKVPPKDPEDSYGDQQRRVCDDAFLQIRSRHDEEFVTFFSDSMLSVPHYFDGKAGDLPFLSQILMRRPSRDPVARPALEPRRHQDPRHARPFGLLVQRPQANRQSGREPLMNLFATVLTYPAPSANYRGESEENRSVIQKITYGRFEYPIISPEAMRNALRETLASYGLPHGIGRDCTTRNSSPSSSPTIPIRISTRTTSSSATWWRPVVPTARRSRRS